MQILLFSIALFFPLATILLRKFLKPQFSIETKHIISFSFDFALKSKLKEIDTDLILYAIAKEGIGVAFQLLKNQGFKATVFIKDFESKPANSFDVDIELIALTNDAQDCLTKAARNGIKNRSTINSGCLLKAILTSNAIITIANKYQIPTTESIDLVLQNSEYKALAKLEKPTSFLQRIKHGFF